MKIPDGTPGGDTTEAVAAAAAASESAAHAHESADLAMEAAVAAAVSAAVAPLKAEIARLTNDEVTDDAEADATARTVMSLQSQWLWICAGCVMFGAALAYVLLKAFE